MTDLISALIDPEEFKQVTRSFQHRVRIQVDDRAGLLRWAEALQWLNRYHGDPRYKLETHEDYASGIYMPGNPQGVWCHVGLERFAFESASLAVIFKLTCGGT